MNLSEYMTSNFLLLDGGMGTLLQEKGLAPGERPERWCISHPDVIRGIHLAYYKAGANVVTTNTFGANLLHFAEDELDAVIGAAVRLAKEAREELGEENRFVALDIGPTGRLLAPLGDLDFEDAVSIFAKTVALGAKHGVDLILIETMNDSYETKAALLAARENSTLPVFVSNAYGGDGKLMTGASPEAMVAMLEGLGAAAVGANCSEGPTALLPVVKRLLDAASVPVLFQPNAGLPRTENGKTVFTISPPHFASEAAEAAKMGVRILGGCCGTTPAHIKALAEALKTIIPTNVVKKTHTAVSSYTHAVYFGEKPILIGERINPTGKKRFKEALLAGDIDYILREGIAEAEAGADILDVNVGLPGVDEKEMLTAAVCELQAVTDLPLQIDTANPIAMEAALRRYNGKPLLNSVNGKQESLDTVLPLAKKYGAAVIALTLDEDGIPATAAARLLIAKKILAAAAQHGIEKKDLIFDTLTMTVSTDRDAARTTLEALRLVREKLGCHTSLGVSNVSFGLPHRDAVNSSFFSLALQNGLSAAILNPHSREMQAAYHTYCLLAGLDGDCANYIKFCETLPESTPVPTRNPATGDKAEEKGEGLRAAIISGRREQAGVLAATMLKTVPPLSVIENEIIPALNTVGTHFEKGKIYLPQLLVCAEAARVAFDEVKAQMPALAVARETVILATVKGDIHDIGKNILHLLLASYGFLVIDLGKDVAPEKILEAVKRENAPLVGLSALMTTTLPAMAETVALLRKECPRCRIMEGGAVLTAEYAASIGADFYAADAMGGVRYAKSLPEKKTQ